MDTAIIEPMTTKSYKPGTRARRSILLELIAEEPLSTVELSNRLPLSQSSIHRHVNTLRNAGMVFVAAKGEGGGVALTHCGREAAEIARSG